MSILRVRWQSTQCRTEVNLTWLGEPSSCGAIPDETTICSNAIQDIIVQWRLALFATIDLITITVKRTLPMIGFFFSIDLFAEIN